MPVFLFICLLLKRLFFKKFCALGFSNFNVPRRMLRKELIIFLIYVYSGVATQAQGNPKVIGAIIDVNTRVGREERVSMELAVAAYNRKSSNQNKLLLQVIDSGGDPLRASTAVKDLIEDKQVEAILGMETWPEAALVAEVANKAHVPVLSFAAPPITPELTSVRWPFLVKMDSTAFQQMKCIASIVRSYEWARVILISEDDSYSSNSGIVKLLSDQLIAVGSEVEHWLAFPPLKTLSNPKASVQEELETLNSKQSRVFILVGPSFELAMHILSRANHNGLMGKDSVWITTNSITNLLNAVENSDMASMQGLIGIKNHFPKNNPSLENFSSTFHALFQLMYPNENISKPGFYAVRAYDAISTIWLALDKLRNINGSSTTGKLVLENILSSNFVGLSGVVHFVEGELSSLTSYEIVNIFGQNCSILNYWSVEYGFSATFSNERSQKKKKSGVGASDTNLVLGLQVHWPGNLQRLPLGWVMPSDGDEMLIGIPSRGSFEEFVKVNNGNEPTGFCIDVFKKAVSLLNYGLRYSFVVHRGTYEEIVNLVYNKTFSAAVGDFTILASRSDIVQFTQPYAESGLTMVAPVRPKDKAWLIVRPFAPTMWFVVASLFLYITSAIWFLEHRSNPDFQGPKRNQLCSAMWFTSTTIFFAHRESLHNKFSRLVMFIWLITVFIITSSYTASLASMLTVKRLEPTVTDMDSLRTSNAHVGYGGDGFVRKYLEDGLLLHPNNIIHIKHEHEYPKAFRNGTIKAAFLEIPYAKALLARYPNDYIDVPLTYRFGGFGFVFPRGSPLARDFSKAILLMSEDGTLNDIWNHWFKSQSRSANSDDNVANERLGLHNFWPLFLVTFVTCTIAVAIHAIQSHTNIQSASIQSTDTTSNRHNAVQNVESDGEDQSHNIEHFSQPTEIEMASRYRGGSNNRLRGLKSAYSFPA